MQFGDPAAPEAAPAPEATAEREEGTAGAIQLGAQAATADGGSRDPGIEAPRLGGDVGPAEAHAAGLPAEDEFDDSRDDDAETSEEDLAGIAADDAAYEAAALAQQYNDPGHDAAHDEL